MKKIIVKKDGKHVYNIKYKRGSSYYELYSPDYSKLLIRLEIIKDEVRFYFFENSIKTHLNTELVYSKNLLKEVLCLYDFIDKNRYKFKYIEEENYNKKQCKMCNRELKTSDFHVHKRTKDGLVPYCKTCTSQYNKEYRDLCKKIKYVQNVER